MFQVTTTVTPTSPGVPGGGGPGVPIVTMNDTRLLLLLFYPHHFQRMVNGLDGTVESGYADEGIGIAFS